MNRIQAIRLFSAFILMNMCASAMLVQAEEKPQMSIGNGDNNWIVLDGVQRNESVLTFKEVQIDGNGWLVMHPFENGAPNGDKYVAYTYLESGKNMDVQIDVLKGVNSAEMFIVMLHRDGNENGVFDFIFVDDQNVMDRAVFENTTMIGHVIAAP